MEKGSLDYMFEKKIFLERVTKSFLGISSMTPILKHCIYHILIFFINIYPNYYFGPTVIKEYIKFLSSFMSYFIYACTYSCIWPMLSGLLPPHLIRFSQEGPVDI